MQKEEMTLHEWPRRTRSIPWVLLPLFLTLTSTTTSGTVKDSLALSSKNKDFSCLCHLSINDWCEMHWVEIYSYLIFSDKCSTTGVNLLLQVVFTWNFLPGVKLSLHHTDCSLLNLGRHYIRCYTTTDCTYADYLLRVIITALALPTGLFTKYLLRMSMQGCLIFQPNPFQLIMCIRDLISYTLSRK